MMAEDQRWGVIAGGSLGGDQCNPCDALLCGDVQEPSENPRVKEKAESQRQAMISGKSNRSTEY